MTQTRKLSAEEFDALFQPGMEDVTASGDALVDIWPYVDAIPATDLGDIVPHDVHYVFRSKSGGEDHVIVATCAENVELVIVVDRRQRSIVGHHLLNLAQLYGVSN